MPPPATLPCRADRSRPVPADCIHPGIHPSNASTRRITLPGGQVATCPCGLHLPGPPPSFKCLHPGKPPITHKKKSRGASPGIFILLNSCQQLEASGQKPSSSSPFHPYHLAFRLALVLDCFLFLQPKYTQ